MRGGNRLASMTAWICSCAVQHTHTLTCMPGSYDTSSIQAEIIDTQQINIPLLPNCFINKSALVAGAQCLRYAWQHGPARMGTVLALPWHGRMLTSPVLRLVRAQRTIIAIELLGGPSTNQTAQASPRTLVPAVMLEMVQQDSFLMLFLWLVISRFSRHWSALQLMMTCVCMSLPVTMLPTVRSAGTRTAGAGCLQGVVHGG